MKSDERVVGVGLGGLAQVGDEKTGDQIVVTHRVLWRHESGDQGGQTQGAGQGDHFWTVDQEGYHAARVYRSRWPRFQFAMTPGNPEHVSCGGPRR